MLSQADNDKLTRTGAGTPMGDFMRRFWLPFLTASELPVSDGAPQRVRLLGEDLIAFRTTDGAVGLVEAFCPHRRAPMFFGRNEEHGLRCVYHGWKFDLNGACVDMPSEPADSLFRDKVRIGAYPVREKGGVLWAYLGPAASMGELSHFAWMGVPEDYRFTGRWLQRSNYAQAIEGELDSAHLSSLHQPIADPADAPAASSFGRYMRDDRAPSWIVSERPYGLSVTARRNADGRGYFRTNHFFLPAATLIAPDEGKARMWRFWVPRDDQTTLVIAINFHEDRAITEAEAAAYRNGDMGFVVKRPGTDWPQPGPDNDYLIDRSVQRTKTATGIPGIRVQDLAMVEGMGTRVDRAREHLGTSDSALIAMRRSLLRGADALAAGTEPAAAAAAGAYAVRAWSAVMTDDEFNAHGETPASSFPSATL
jgi:phthalate 4,5-dioxygenase